MWRYAKPCLFKVLSGLARYGTLVASVQGAVSCTVPPPRHLPTVTSHARCTCSNFIRVFADFMRPTDVSTGDRLRYIWCSRAAGPFSMN